MALFGAPFAHKDAARRAGMQRWLFSARGRGLEQMTGLVLQMQVALQSCFTAPVRRPPDQCRSQRNDSQAD